MAEDAPQFVMGSAQRWGSPSRARPSTARKPSNKAPPSFTHRLLAAGRAVLPSLLLQRLRLPQDPEPPPAGPPAAKHPREVSPDPRPAKHRRTAPPAAAGGSSHAAASAALLAAAATPLPPDDHDGSPNEQQPAAAPPAWTSTPITPAPPPLRVREGTLRPRTRRQLQGRQQQQQSGAAAPVALPCMTPPAPVPPPPQAPGAAAGASPGVTLRSSRIRLAAPAAAAAAGDSSPQVTAAQQQQHAATRAAVQEAGAAAPDGQLATGAAAAAAITPGGAEGRGPTPYWTPLPPPAISRTAAAAGSDQDAVQPSPAAAGAAVTERNTSSHAAATAPHDGFAAKAAAAASAPAVAATPLHLDLVQLSHIGPHSSSKYPAPFFAVAPAAPTSSGGSSSGRRKSLELSGGKAAGPAGSGSRQPAAAGAGISGSRLLQGAQHLQGQLPHDWAHDHMRRQQQQQQQQGLPMHPAAAAAGGGGAVALSQGFFANSSSLPGSRVVSPVQHRLGVPGTGIAGGTTSASLPATRVTSPVGMKGSPGHPGSPPGVPPLGPWAVVKPLPENALGRYVMSQAAAAAGADGGAGTAANASQQQQQQQGGRSTGHGHHAPSTKHHDRPHHLLHKPTAAGGEIAAAGHAHSSRGGSDRQQQQQHVLGVAHPAHKPAHHQQQEHHQPPLPLKAVLQEQLLQAQQQQQQQQLPAGRLELPSAAAAAAAAQPSSPTAAARKRTGDAQLLPDVYGAKVQHTAQLTSPRHPEHPALVTPPPAAKTAATALLGLSPVAVEASSRAAEAPAAAATEEEAAAPGVRVGSQLKVQLLDDSLEPTGTVVQLAVAAPLGRGTFGSTWRASTQQVATSNPGAAAFSPRSRCATPRSGAVTPRLSRSASVNLGQPIPSVVVAKVAHRFDQCTYPPGYDREMHEADMQTTYCKEYGILAAVASPNVVATYGLGQMTYDDGESVLVILLELVAGGALDDWMQRHALTALQPSAARQLLHEVALGLAALHDEQQQRQVAGDASADQRWFHSVVHRDCKPANLLVVPAPAAGAGRSSSSRPGIARLKLADFGSAAILAVPEDTADDCDGTPLYMAPEVAAKQPHGAAADVYSLGVLYVFLRFGGKPFAYLWRQLHQRVWQWQGQWLGGLTGKRLDQADVTAYIAAHALNDEACPYNAGVVSADGDLVAAALTAEERSWLKWVMALQPEARPTMQDVLQDARGFFSGGS